MDTYIINKNKDNKGNNEIHNITDNCGHLPKLENISFLGSFENENAAKIYAKNNGWPFADGCAFCCPKAHTK